jgi:hypothetical protein
VETSLIDLDSNNLVLALVLVVVIALIRTLIFAGKEINSSDRFPTSKNPQEGKKDDDNSLQN